MKIKIDFSFDKLGGIFLTKKDNGNPNISEVNERLNSQLDEEDYAVNEKSSTIEATNRKLNEAFNDEQDHSSINAPTYMYNNTPAIKINRKAES